MGLQGCPLGVPRTLSRPAPCSCFLVSSPSTGLSSSSWDILLHLTIPMPKLPDSATTLCLPMQPLLCPPYTGHTHLKYVGKLASLEITVEEDVILLFQLAWLYPMLWRVIKFNFPNRSLSSSLKKWQVQEMALFQIPSTYLRSHQEQPQGQ